MNRQTEKSTPPRFQEGKYKSLAQGIHRGKSSPVGMVDDSRIRKSLGCIDG